MNLGLIKLNGYKVRNQRKKEFALSNYIWFSCLRHNLYLTGSLLVPESWKDVMNDVTAVVCVAYLSLCSIYFLT